MILLFGVLLLVLQDWLDWLDKDPLGLMVSKVPFF